MIRLLQWTSRIGLMAAIAFVMLLGLKLGAVAFGWDGAPEEGTRGGSPEVVVAIGPELRGAED